MLGLAALALEATLAPNFVQPIEPGPILAVHASINDKDALIGIDTGSYRLLVKPDVIGKASTVTLNFIPGSTLNPRVTDFPSRVQAIVGLNELHDKAIGIDVKDHALSIWNAGNLSDDQVKYWFSHTPINASWTDAPPLTYTAVDLENAAGDGHFLIDAQVDGQPVKLGLDTDSSTSAIEPSAVADKGFTGIGDSQFGGLHEGWQVHLGFVDSLAMGDQNLQAFPMAEVPEGRVAPAQGLIGFNFFQDRRAIIDFAAHKLYLGAPDPAPTGNDMLLPLGIRLAPFVNGKQFIGVIPGSPAATAGLHTGDELLQVDGKPIAVANLPATSSTLPVDYSKTGLPKTLPIVAKSSTGQTITCTISN